MYYVIDEASEELYFNEYNLQEAINDISYLPQQGKYLVLDEEDNIVYDSKPGISYKL